MHSTWQSVAEQTGIFAGKGGFDVTVGEHTQLNGAVISSTASADKNRLDTGTLGFGNIENHAEYEVEHQSAGMSTGGSIGGQFAGNMANGMLAGLNDSGSAHSTTKAAVSEGTIVIRDKEQQAQDVADLSRDVANANPGLDVIFDKEKEQNRLKAAQLIGEIGAQAGDIARTQGQIAGLKAQQDPATFQAAREELAGKGKLNPTADEVAKQAYDTAQKPFGTGGKVQRAISAVTAAVQGLSGGNVAQAISGAAAPYLAEKIHELTMDANGKVNTEANLMAHAVLGAVTSYAAGNAALAGASGAVMGEYIAQQLYPGVKRSDLSEEQRQTISALGTLAAGLAGGVVGDSTADAVAGAQAGKNAVENNHLSFGTGMNSYGAAVKSWNQYAEANGLTPEQKQAGLDKLAKGDLPEGANITKVIVNGYKDGVLIAGAWYLGPAASVGKVVGGAAIAEIANGTYQWFDISSEKNQSLPENQRKTWDYWGSASAAVTGALAPGRGVWQNVGIAAGGAVFTDGGDVGAVGGAALGAWAGGKFGELAPFPGEVNDLFGGIGGEIISNKFKDKVNEK
ncbi:UNVERIFIED_ORG: filamentous hemagglutinin [Pantoea brenneri]|nr:filamentous hemagglutinin [Pantoea brenneri]